MCGSDIFSCRSQSTLATDEISFDDALAKSGHGLLILFQGIIKLIDVSFSWSDYILKGDPRMENMSTNILSTRMDYVHMACCAQ